MSTPAPSDDPTVQAQLAVIEAAYGDRLTDDDRAILRAGIARALANSATLSAFPLANGDEPGTVFHAARGE